MKKNGVSEACTTSIIRMMDKQHVKNHVVIQEFVGPRGILARLMGRGVMTRQGKRLKKSQRGWAPAMQRGGERSISDMEKERATSGLPA